MRARDSTDGMVRKVVNLVFVFFLIYSVGASCGIGDSEPNDDFSSAVSVSGECFADGAFNGAVGGAGDGVDVYRVGGTYAKGSHIDFSGIVGDFLVAFFDDEQNLIYRKSVNALPSLDFLFYEDTYDFFVAFAPYLGGEDTYSGDSYISQEAVPELEIQKILIDFNGATSAYVHGQDFSFGPIEQSFLAEEYPGRVQAIKDEIVRIFREKHGPYNVAVYTTDEGVSIQPPYSVVYLGDISHENLLGLADNVDQRNFDKSQNAIVFVDSFERYVALGLNDMEMATMISNVACHEVGHLLGLSHVADPDAIMCTTGTGWDLAQEQDFKRAPLELDVFLMGYQDSPGLLSENLGLFSGQPCVDSDGGLNYYVGGTLQYNPVPGVGYEYSLRDSCSGDTLNEYYCDGDIARTEYYLCENGCSESRCLYSCGERDVPCCIAPDGVAYCNSEYDSCVDGICKTCGFEGGPRCTDSGGNSFCKDGLFECADQICSSNCGSHGGRAIGEVCELYYECGSEECVDGLCVAECVDSDDGLDYFTQGTTKRNPLPGGGYEYLFVDYCWGGGNVREYYCNGDYISSEDYLCEHDCLWGRCLEEDLNYCVDSDDGLDYFIQGTVQYNPVLGGGYGDSLTDYCWGQKVYEFYCEDERVMVTDHICEYECGSGACLESECQDGIDNDGDGRADYPGDFSCYSLEDDDEYSPLSQCQDGIDNDGDDLIDLDDSDCGSAQDNSEMCSQGWVGIPGSDLCFGPFEYAFGFGITRIGPYQAALDYCESLGGRLPSAEELDGGCDLIDLSPRTQALRSVWTTDVFETGHKRWHDKGYHFSNEQCGEVWYDWCGTLVKDSGDCSLITYWADDENYVHYGCMVNPGGPECGDTIVQEGEECDDGANGHDNDECYDDCTLTHCGDGIVQQPNGEGFYEECDGEVFASPPLNARAEKSRSFEIDKSLIEGGSFPEEQVAMCNYNCEVVASDVPGAVLRSPLEWHDWFFGKVIGWR